MRLKLTISTGIAHIRKKKPKRVLRSIQVFDHFVFSISFCNLQTDYRTARKKAILFSLSVSDRFVKLVIRFVSMVNHREATGFFFTFFSIIHLFWNENNWKQYQVKILPKLNEGDAGQHGQRRAKSVGTALSHSVLLHF